MGAISERMTAEHRACEALFMEAEAAVAGADWAAAEAALSRFQAAVVAHFRAEEEQLFPAFERRTGIRHGPTRVMCYDHDEIRGKLATLEKAVRERERGAYLAASETFLMLMQLHNSKEESVIYPMSDQYLSEPLDAGRGGPRRGR